MNEKTNGKASEKFYAKKSDTVRYIALVGAGSAAAFGAAFWSVSNVFALPAVPTAHHTAHVPMSGGSVAAAPAPAIALSTPVSAAAGIPGKHERDQQEANLAPSAEPFISYNERPDSARVGQAVVTHPAAPPASSAKPLPAAPSAQSTMATALSVTQPFVSALPPMGSLRVEPLKAPAPPSPPLELAGTLLGDSPSAVFQGSTQLITVPVGGEYGGWKVVKVSHGEVVLKGMGRTLHLALGVPSPDLDQDRSVSTRKFVTSADDTQALPPPREDSTLAPTAVRSDSDVIPASGAGVEASLPEAGAPASNAGVAPSLQSEPLPALPDTKLTPQGKVAPPPVDSASRDRSLPSVERGSHTSLISHMAPFRRLMVPEGTAGAAPALPSHHIVLAAASTPQPAAHARAHATMRRVRHHHHRHHHHHGHRRYSHRRPMHQQRQIA